MEQVNVTGRVDVEVKPMVSEASWEVFHAIEATPLFMEEANRLQNVLSALVGSLKAQATAHMQMQATLQKHDQTLTGGGGNFASAASVDALAKRLAKMEEQMAAVAGKQADLEGRLGGVETKVANFDWAPFAAAEAAAADAQKALEKAAAADFKATTAEGKSVAAETLAADAAAQVAELRAVVDALPPPNAGNSNGGSKRAPSPPVSPPKPPSPPPLARLPSFAQKGPDGAALESMLKAGLESAAVRTDGLAARAEGVDKRLGGLEDRVGATLDDMDKKLKAALYDLENKLSPRIDAVTDDSAGHGTTLQGHAAEIAALASQLDAASRAAAAANRAAAAALAQAAAAAAAAASAGAGAGAGGIDGAAGSSEGAPAAPVPPAFDMSALLAPPEADPAIERRIAALERLSIGAGGDNGGPGGAGVSKDAARKAAALAAEVEAAKAKLAALENLNLERRVTGLESLSKEAGDRLAGLESLDAGARLAGTDRAIAAVAADVAAGRAAAAELAAEVSSLGDLRPAVASLEGRAKTLETAVDKLWARGIPIPAMAAAAAAPAALPPPAPLSAPEPGMDRAVGLSEAALEREMHALAQRLEAKLEVALNALANKLNALSQRTERCPEDVAKLQAAVANAARDLAAFKDAAADDKYAAGVSAAAVRAELKSHAGAMGALLAALSTVRTRVGGLKPLPTGPEVGWGMLLPAVEKANADQADAEARAAEAALAAAAAAEAARSDDALRMELESTLEAIKAEESRIVAEVETARAAAGEERAHLTSRLESAGGAPEIADITASLGALASAEAAAMAAAEARSADLATQRESAERGLLQLAQSASERESRGGKGRSGSPGKAGRGKGPTARGDFAGASHHELIQQLFGLVNGKVGREELGPLRKALMAAVLDFLKADESDRGENARVLKFKCLSCDRDVNYNRLTPTGMLALKARGLAKLEAFHPSREITTAGGLGAFASGGIRGAHMGTPWEDAAADMAAGALGAAASGRPQTAAGGGRAQSARQAGSGSRVVRALRGRPVALAGSAPGVGGLSPVPIAVSPPTGPW